MLVDALDDALTVFAATAPELRPARAGQPRAHGRRGARPPGAGRRHRGLGGPLPAPPRRRPASGRPAGRRRLAGRPGRRGALSRMARPLRARAGRPPARRRGGRMGAPACCPGRSAPPPTGSSAPAHALRGLGGADTPPRRLELASALAFWGSSYQELPGPPLLIGHQQRARGPGRAALPSRGRPAPAAHQRHGGPGDRHRRRVRAGRVLAGRRRRLHRAARTSWPPGVRWPTCATRTGAGPSACSIRSPRPWPASSSCPGSRQEDHDAALGYAWQAVAALHVAYALDRHGPAPARGASSAEALVDMAIASGDEHAIKLTEAALRCLQALRGPDAAVGGGGRLRPPLSPAVATGRAARTLGKVGPSHRRRETVMEYRTLGRTGVKVSPLCLGAMMFGSFGNHGPRRLHPHHPPRRRRRDQLHRHRGHVFVRRVRGDRRQGAGPDQAAPDRAGHQGARRDGARPQRAGQLAALDHGRVRAQPAPVGHRLHRPLPDPPARRPIPTSTRRSAR